MKEHLLQILGLQEGTEEQIIAAVNGLAQKANGLERENAELTEGLTRPQAKGGPARDPKREKAIALKMAAGMTRENAELVLAHQSEADDRRASDAKRKAEK